jgi:quercetin dioxygenase-like cupin family protein
VYAAHTHADHKVLYCLRGSIMLTLPDTGEQITLNPGDRLDLPPGVLHAATSARAGGLPGGVSAGVEVRCRAASLRRGGRPEI